MAKNEDDPIKEIEALKKQREDAQRKFDEEQKKFELQMQEAQQKVRDSLDKNKISEYIEYLQLGGYLIIHEDATIEEKKAFQKSLGIVSLTGKPQTEYKELLEKLVKDSVDNNNNLKPSMIEDFLNDWKNNDLNKKKGTTYPLTTTKNQIKKINGNITFKQ